MVKLLILTVVVSLITRSRPELFFKKGVLRNFTKFTGKTCARDSFLIKLQVSGLKTVTLLKKNLCHKCFPVNFGKFLRTPFLQNTLVAASV